METTTFLKKKKTSIRDTVIKIIEKKRLIKCEQKQKCHISHASSVIVGFF